MTTEPDPILSAFHDTGAYLRGHFQLTSGLHSPEYLQCARVLQYPRHAEHFGRLLATEFRRLEPALDTAIVGTKNVAHLRDNVAAARKGPLPEDSVAEVKRRLDLTASKPT